MSDSLTITFLHHGRKRTLAKHPKIRQALKHGKITLEQARQYPWYLRLTVDDKETSFKLAKLPKADVLTEARDFLNSRAAKPNEFIAFMAAREAARSVTLGELAKTWVAAGMPFTKNKFRTAKAAANLSGYLTRALQWWADKPVSTIAIATIEDYAATRATAPRSADLELNALSCLCSWARLTGQISANPFLGRPTFGETKQHCHEVCPADDDTMHRVVAWLFDTPVRDCRSPEHQNIVVGGILIFCALSGLRPGEPKFLKRIAPLAATPASADQLAPGTIFPDRTGQLRMKVVREKHGQNPFVILTPALESFLSAWRAWLAANMVEATQLFPLGASDDVAYRSVLKNALNSASKALDLPHFKPHGFGRAYYVKVRRSQGADDSTIASELGQATDGELIRNTYGDPDDLCGGQMHDWLPTAGPAAWAILGTANLAQRRAAIEASQAAKKIAVAAVQATEQGTRPGHGKDTSATTQDRGNATQDSLVVFSGN